jgi:hypothetical protein
MFLADVDPGSQLPSCHRTSFHSSANTIRTENLAGISLKGRPRRRPQSAARGSPAWPGRLKSFQGVSHPAGHNACRLT